MPVSGIVLGEMLPFAESEPGATGLELLLPLTLKWATEAEVPLPQALARITHLPARILGTGAGTLNAVQQFAGAIGVAALGTVFFARVGHPSVHSYFAAAELVFAITAGLYFLTLLLVCLLPRHRPAGTLT